MGRISVTVDDSHLHVTQEVADALRHNGMDVDQVLDAVGIITGSVPEGGEELLAAVEGVASIDRQSSFELPPPDADLQ
jgi:hypothetical protein